MSDRLRRLMLLSLLPVVAVLIVPAMLGSSPRALDAPPVC